MMFINCDSQRINLIINNDKLMQKQNLIPCTLDWEILVSAIYFALIWVTVHIHMGIHQCQDLTNKINYD